MLIKVFKFTILAIALTLLAIWSPWSSWNISFLETLGLAQQDKYSGLQIYSTNGELEVLVDSEVVGNVTVEGSPLEIFEIEPGDHLVTLHRISEGVDSGYYYEFSRMINFIEGINTVIAYEIGPSDYFSGGYVIYATPSIDDNSTYLNVRTQSGESKVYLNDLEIGSTPVTNRQLDTSTTYKVKITQEAAEGIEFNLFPDTQDERDAFKGYDLNVEAHLFRLPIETREE